MGIIVLFDFFNLLEQIFIHFFSVVLIDQTDTDFVIYLQGPLDEVLELPESLERDACQLLVLARLLL